MSSEPRRPACREAVPATVRADEILVVRRGTGANCSSIGSLLDIVLLSAVAGGVVLVAAAAALGGRAGPPPDAGAPEQEPSPEREDENEGPDAR